MFWNLQGRDPQFRLHPFYFFPPFFLLNYSFFLFNYSSNISFLFSLFLTIWMKLMTRLDLQEYLLIRSIYVHRIVLFCWHCPAVLRLAQYSAQQLGMETRSNATLVYFDWNCSKIMRPFCLLLSCSSDWIWQQLIGNWQILITVKLQGETHVTIQEIRNF